MEGGGGEKERERGRREGAREQKGEGWLSVRRGSELKKASRREPSVWMHSLISKKKKKEGMKGEKRADEETASSLLFLANKISINPYMHHPCYPSHVHV